MFNLQEAQTLSLGQFVNSLPVEEFMHTVDTTPVGQTWGDTVEKLRAEKYPHITIQ